MKTINWITFILVVVGGLNWGLVGIANFNLVSAVFGEGALTNLVYDLVGLSAIYILIFGGKMMAQKQV